MASIDEAGCQESGSGENSGDVMGEAGDNGECLVNKGSKRASFMGGAFLDNTSTPAMTVCKQWSFT